MTRIGFLLLLMCSATLAAAIPASARAADTRIQRFEAGGVAVEFRFEPRTDADFVDKDNPTARGRQPWSQPGVAHLAFKDAATGRAYEGMQPAAWMTARRSQQVADELSCEAKAQQLIQSSLGSRADIDLNTYRLVTLNQDDTVAFINPFVSLKNSKLESIIPLPGRGYDWVLLADKSRLLVSLRDVNAVAVIDTVNRKLLGKIGFQEGSRPTRLLPDADGKRVWVGLDGRAEVAVIDALTISEVARIPTGRGVHTLTNAADAARVFVTNADDSTVSMIDSNDLRRITNVAVRKTPVAAAWSEAAGKLAVVTINGGTLDLIDPVAEKVTQSLPLEKGAIQIGLFDQGRNALVVNHLKNSATLIDLSTSQIKDSVEVSGKPDQIEFTREFAYVRGQATASVSAISLKAARSGRLQVVSIPMGQRAPQDAAESIGVANMLAQAPEGNGILIANAADGYIYRYAEGMMAPVGNFSNYKRQARALLVLDSSLTEQAPGSFVAPVNFQFGGYYDVVVKSQNPSVTACFVTKIDGPTQSEALAANTHTISATLEPLQQPSHGQNSGHDSNAAMIFRIRLADANKQPVLGVTDGMLLMVQRFGQWQERAWIRELGEGRYEAQLPMPEQGDFDVLLSVPSQQLDFVHGRLGRISLPLVQNTRHTIAASEDTR